MTLVLHSVCLSKIFQRTSCLATVSFSIAGAKVRTFFIPAILCTTFFQKNYRNTDNSLLINEKIKNIFFKTVTIIENSTKYYTLFI